MKRGQMFVADFPTAKANMREAINTKDMVAHVDYMQEWAQIFDEVWRAFRDGFYLENMHAYELIVLLAVRCKGHTAVKEDLEIGPQFIDALLAGDVEHVFEHCHHP
mgnify:CR=1 FL=1